MHGVAALPPTPVPVGTVPAAPGEVPVIASPDVAGVTGN